MANALSGMTPPPAPFDRSDNNNAVALPQPPMPGVSSNALAKSAVGSQQQPDPGQIPAPSHQQTVAAIRHFQVISSAIRKLLMNPDCGKSNIKSPIIDAVTKLVGDRIISPAQAVTTLGTVPDRPFDQKKWLEDQFTQQTQAEAMVLDHHRASTPGTGDLNLEGELHPMQDEDHMGAIGSLMSQHYSGKPNG